VDLSYDVFDGPVSGPPLVFLHGLFGSKSNFQSIAKAVVQRTGRKVLTVDARNHGDSPHSPTMTLEAMTLDLVSLLNKLQQERCVLIGHSMGGKIAMMCALQKPEVVERLIVVDVSPSPTTLLTNFHSYISAMKRITLESNVPRSEARRQAEEQLQAIVTKTTVRQFLLTNLVYRDGQYVWRVNLDAIDNHLDDLVSFPEFSTAYCGSTLFLGGGDSPYISSEDFPAIERLFPNSDIQYIPGAGHWVHAEKSHDFLNAVCTFLEAQ
uniref:sn-1-specific diacylglycerol lipase ABHD11 n=2 Tax=Latimeria chalumnae TaxID=7897 RepID=H3B128_LATCH